MSNPVTRWQIITPDPGASATFYSKLFGWTLSADNALGYREFGNDGSGLSGGVWPAPPSAKPFVQVFVAVDDVDRYITDAEKLGAKVIVPASTLPDGDRMAILADPSGMSFGVCKQR